MKILTAQQIREADKYTIAHEPIASIDLMERAATACFKWIVNKFESNKTFNIICGTGNNGGDGLAIARLLHNAGYQVKIFIVSLGKTSEDFSITKNRLAQLKNISIAEINSAKDFPPFHSDEILVDCIFGTGLSKPPTGCTYEVIKAVNQSGCQIVSVDIPSGLFADATSKNSVVVKANYTLTFQTLKPAFMFPENAELTGEIIILPIGLNEKFIYSLNPFGELVEENFIKEIIKPRKIFSHKGSYGHAAIIAGSFGKIGAAVLATRACMRTGAGLTTAIIPKCGYNIMQTSVPEAMTVCSDTENYLSGNFNTEKYSAIGIGPGIGNEKETVNFLKQIIQNTNLPMVLDADALNILAENKTWLDFLPQESILTPHPKEFERLCGKSSDDFERHQKQKEFSQRHSIYVVLKGRYTCITTTSGKTFFNPTGNPGIAKGGSGDVLTGIITSFLAQGYSPFESCIVATYLHGLAGDCAAKTTGNYSMLASDLIENLGNAFLHLLG